MLIVLLTMDRLSALFAALNLPAVALVLGVPLVIFLASTLLSGIDSAAGPPLIGAEYGSLKKRRQAHAAHAKDLLQKGYDQYRTRVFRFTTPDGV